MQRAGFLTSRLAGFDLTAGSGFLRHHGIIAVMGSRPAAGYKGWSTKLRVEPAGIRCEQILSGEEKRWLCTCYYPEFRSEQSPRSG
jgi:hypothetical protein